MFAPRTIALMMPCLAWITLSSPHQAENPKPGVIPTLRQWVGGSGNLELSKLSRIVVESSQAQVLLPIAKTLRDDLKEVNGWSLRINTENKPGHGDIVLTINPDMKANGDEGYKLEVEDTAEASSNSAVGVFWATRSLLQIISLSPQHCSLPKGSALDWPEYHERGFMLDVGRKFFDVKYLRQYVKFMSWYKLNDFQLHLNDNAAHDYSGFRLSSDKFPGLANQDGAYSHRQIDELQDLAADYHVAITPEIDAPAHARAFTKYHPDLGNPKLPKDHLDLANPKTQEFIDSIWAEFTPWFRTPNMHIGADEYNGGSGSAPLYKAYINATAKFIRSQGKQVRIWGGLKTAGNSDGVDRDIVVNLWYPGYHDPIEAVNDGYKIINTQDDELYIVPFAGYYYQFLDTKRLYNSWKPTDFGKQKLPDADPRVLGGMFAVWNDKGEYPYRFEDVHELVKPAMPTLGELLWSGHPKDARSYDSFVTDANQLGDGPGVKIEAPKITQSPGDLAFGKTGDASERKSGNFGVGALFDGRAPTRWFASDKKPQWVSVDLGAVDSISKVLLRWVPDSQAAQYMISTSEDGKNWTTVFETDNGKGGDEIVRFSPKQARYLRLDFERKGGTTGSYSLFTVEVHR